MVKRMKKTIGIIAHVDAGKTTLSERVLFESRAIRKMGRVDHQDSFLDTNEMERRRGITIFSGQAVIPLGDDTLYWVDTPGHVDFVAEAERSLSILDYSVLVVCSASGIQSHTETLWQLLQAYRVPTLIFLSKTDRVGADPDGVLKELQRRLSPDILDFRSWQHLGQPDDSLMEELAARDESLLEAYLAGSAVTTDFSSAAVSLLKGRMIAPVLSGSALTGEGMEGFLPLLNLLTSTDYEKRTGDPLSARVYQVRHDAQGQRLCFVKLLGGTLRVKDELNGQKVNELRIYHGEKYHPAERAEAGDLVALPGMPELRAGDVIGQERASFRMEPMMAADVVWDREQVPTFRMHQALLRLEDEEPTLGVEKREEQLTVHIMGKIQLEILRQQLQDLLSAEVSFGAPRVLYRETITAPAVGVGHYEPLRHYAEVHVRLAPTAPGSGISFRSLAHVDELALNWQRLIETHVFEKVHKGVLTGSPLTDVRVELLSGRAHLKHTEGGDFRQATYRAIRNALMHAESVLLEPICGFCLQFPQEYYGAVMGSLQRMRAACDAPEAGQTVTLSGTVPLSTFYPWQDQFLMLTHGRGTQRVWLSHYAPCTDQAALVAEAAYHPLADDTPDSVFCSHGAGYTVPWDEVAAHAHLPVEEASP